MLKSNYAGTTTPTFQVGKDGFTLLQGASVPSSGLGSVGDLYVRTGSTPQLYQKTDSSTWTLLGAPGGLTRVPILGFGTVPDNSGDVFVEPYTIKATNKKWERLVFVFNDTSTPVALHGGFTIPEEYEDEAKIIVSWTSTATSGSVAWDFYYRAVGGDDSESLDQSGVQQAVTFVDNAPSSAYNKLESIILLTDENLTAGDEVEFDLIRDGANASDTMSAAAILFNALFEYDSA